MKINIVPETEEEGDEVTYSGVKNLFMFGCAKEDTDSPHDFHQWNGDYRFLIGGLAYFYEVIKDERSSKLTPPERSPYSLNVLSGNQDNNDKDSKLIKHNQLDEPEIQMVDIPQPGHDLKDDVD